MGTLLEALWGYYVNQVLLNEGGEAAACEIGWLAGHEYNDFADGGRTRFYSLGPGRIRR